MRSISVRYGHSDSSKKKKKKKKKKTGKSFEHFFVMSLAGSIQELFGCTDLYVILGVASTASDVEIKRAFRRKALSLHPDKHQFVHVTATFCNGFTVGCDNSGFIKYLEGLF